MNDMIPDHLGFGDRACPDDAKCQKIAPRWFVLSMLVFLCLGICFRVFEPNQKVLWEDEIAGTIRMLGYTEAEIVRASPSFETAADLQEYFRLRGIGVAKRPDIASTVKSLASEDPQHPPLYYLILHLWVAVFGSSVTAMRSLSIIFSICVLPCIYFLCIELFSSRIAALLGAAIVAVSPFHLLYAQEVREYSLWTVAVIVLSLNFLRALRLRSVSAWAVYGLTLAFSLYVFPLSLLVALGESIYVIILNAVRPSKGIFAYFGAACTAGLAIFVPWLIIMLSSEGLRRGEHSILTTHRSPEKTLVTLIRDVRQIFFDFGSYSSPSWKVIIAELILTLFLGVVVAYACRLILRTGDRRSLVFIVVTLCLPLAPLALYPRVNMSWYQRRRNFIVQR